NRISHIDVSTNLLALAINGEWVLYGSLDTETVESRAVDLVVVETGCQACILHRLVGLNAIDNSLIQVGGTQSPDFAAEHDVVAVMCLTQVIKRIRLFWIGQDIAPTFVMDLNKALLDINIWRPVLAHRPQFHKMTIRRTF